MHRWIAPWALVAIAVIAPGSVRTGAVVSITVTVEVAVEGLPWPSLLVQVTVVGPTEKGVPLSGLQVTDVGPST